VAAGAEPGHVDAGLGDGVLGRAAAPAGHRLSLLQLLLVRGQQSLDHLRQVVDVGGEPVDAGADLRQQGGMLGGEELRAFQRLFELADLAAGPGAGQLGQHLGVALPGDQVLHDVPAGHPVQVGDHGRQLDRSFSARFFSRLRSSVRSRRYRVCSRMIRNSGVATKQEVTAPRSKHAASHLESDGSRLGRPGRFLTCLASASTHSNPSASSR
jgi:hypothetical protein